MFPLKDDVRHERLPFATWALMLVNLVVFALELATPGERLAAAFQRFGLVPARYAAAWEGGATDAAGLLLPLLTSQFLHGGWVHLIGNLWTLWIFGDNVEDRMGRVRFLVFYLLCGILAGAVHAATNPSSTVPTVGASGAIAGVLGAYVFLFPTARVLVLFPVFFYPLFFELPAVVFIGFWFYAQFLSGTLALASPEAAGGVAWWAHVGGFLVGALLFGLFLRPRREGR